jgi:SAM-dependent methyltransferase
MNSATIDRLVSLNQEFYLRFGTSFYKTRVHPWHTWPQLVERILHKPHHLLDIGCGTARWFSYLVKTDITIEDGIGIDVDSFSLSCARSVFVADSRFRFYQEDTIGNLEACLPHCGQPTLATAFGIWHHIPSFELRVKNMQLLVNALAPGGMMCLSLWQFGKDQDYTKKIFQPAEVAETVGIDVGEFEQGDHFLGWQDTKAALRFCHSFSDEEIVQLAHASGLEYEVLYGSQNDKNNAYLVLTKPH